MDLTVFCADEDGRYELSKVFVQRGYKCATNGRIAVRVKSNEPDTEGTFPNLNEIFSGNIHKIKPINIIHPEQIDHFCEMCDNGRIYFYDDCDACYGGGTCSCSCPTEHECGKCGGEGRVPIKSKLCQYCEGSKKASADLEIEDEHFKGHFLRLAHNHLIGLTAIGTSESGKILILTHDNGDCAIMSFTKTG